MRIFYCPSHDGVYLTGCSIIVAPDVQKAQEMLDKELKQRGLQQSHEWAYDLIELDYTLSQVLVLQNGDY